MKHAASRELYAYWQEKRGTRPAPERTEIEPGAIRGVLADAFILALDRGSSHPIRLRRRPNRAQTRVPALEKRRKARDAMMPRFMAPRRRRGFMVYDGAALSIRRPIFARAIGVLAPLKIPSWLGTGPIGPLTIGGRR